MIRKRNKPKSRERIRRKRERRPSPLMQAALEHHRAGRVREAASLYESLVTQNPRHSEALHFLGTLAMQQGNHRGAVDFARRALAIDSEHPSYHFTLGTSLFALGDVDDAIDALERCVVLKPDFFQGYLNLADGLRAANRLPQAEACLTKALTLEPESGEALARLGATHRAAENLQSALVCFERIVEKSLDSADAHFDLADILKRLGRTNEAVTSYRTGLVIHRGNASAHNNLGECLLNLGFHDAAIKALEESLRHAPSLVEAHNNLGLGQNTIGDTQSAIASFQNALALRPTFAPAHYNLANTLHTEARLTEAVAAYQEAIRLEPSYHEAHNNLGGVFQSQGKLDEAQTAYRQALRVKPDAAQTGSNLLFCLNYRDDIDPDDVYRMHRQWEQSHSLARSPSHNNKIDRNRKLRIGYVSADFREHSVAYFSEPLLTAHDKSGFEVFAYADVPRADAFTQRFRQCVTTWRDIAALDDEQVVELVRGDAIDVLIDLTGHTARSRLRVFSAKPAPIQVTCIGYPNTTGLSNMDYRLTDARADPVGETEHYHTEELIRLKDCLLCYKPPGDAPAIKSRTARGDHSVTFGSFNNLSKVTPQVVRVWSEILTAVEGSTLLLKGTPLSDPPTRQRYEAHFAQHGIERGRLDLLGRVEPTSGHLDLYNRIDLALDPFPYNGTTTTCESLWMGVPVVTLAGGRHAGRVGVSLLSAIGAEDWIAQTRQSYVEKAVELANNLERGCERGSSLCETMRRSALLDASGFTRQLERVYREIWSRWCEHA